MLTHGFHVRALVRKEKSLTEIVEQVALSDLNILADIEAARPDDLERLKQGLRGIDTLVHLSGRAHILKEDLNEPLEEFRRTNRDATIALASLAQDAGVERFVFISSIGVNGNLNHLPFSESDVPNPVEDYAISKHEAEIALLDMAACGQMEVTIIRPPLVYGAGAPGNFKLLLGLISQTRVLPFGAIKNKRSFVAINNLIDFIVTCIDHPKAANQVFLISDGEDVSTTQLLQKMAKAFEKRLILLPTPVFMMSYFLKLVGKGRVADRLFGSLQVDSSKARKLLGWKPVVTMDEQLKKIAEAYLHEKNL